MCAKKKNVEKRNFIQCSTCNVALFPDECFQLFHTKDIHKENLFNYFVPKMYCGCSYRMKNISQQKSIGKAITWKQIIQII